MHLRRPDAQRLLCDLVLKLAFLANDPEIEYVRMDIGAAGETSIVQDFDTRLTHLLNAAPEPVRDRALAIGRKTQLKCGRVGVHSCKRENDGTDDLKRKKGYN